MRIPALRTKEASEALKISKVRFPTDPGEMNMLPMCEVMPTLASVVDPSYNPA